MSQSWEPPFNRDPSGGASDRQRLGPRAASPPPPAPPFRLGWGYVRDADKWCAVAVLVGAVAFDLGVRQSLATVAGFLAFGGVIAALFLSRRVTGRRSTLVLGAALVLALALPFRASAWLIPFDVLAALLLIAVAVITTRGGSIFDAGVPTWAVRFTAVGMHLMAAGAFLLPPLFTTKLGGAKLRPLVIGLLAIAPVFLVVLLLLASADSVFASLIDFDLEIDSVFEHLFLLVVGGWLVGGLLAAASSHQPSKVRDITWRMGAAESVAGLAAVVVLYFVFVVTQIVVLVAGDDFVRRTSGLTYAEYARDGYFQLLAVAVITIGLLLVQRSTISTADAKWHRIWRMLAVALVVLTLAMLGSALQRLSLYEDAYGLTMLRLYSSLFAGLLAVVLMMVALRCLGVGGRREWLPASVTTASLVLLLGLNLVNPEALVVNRNLDRTDPSEAALDASYLASLTDGLPTLADRYGELSPERQQQIGSALCPPLSERFRTESGITSLREAAGAFAERRWYEYNRGQAEAMEATQKICAQHKPDGSTGR